MVVWEEYERIDAFEKSRGKDANPQAPRVKILSMDEMLRVAKGE